MLSLTYNQTDCKKVVIDIIKNKGIDIMKKKLFSIIIGWFSLHFWV